MKLYLIKQNKKSTGYALIATDGHLMRMETGKVGKPSEFRSTSNAGSEALAQEAAQREAEAYRAKGYVDAPPPRSVEGDGVLDKAKWHLNDEFPRELASEQSYVHTGMFVAWLIHRELSGSQHSPEAERLTSRKVLPSTFYREVLDGVFCLEDVAPVARDFVQQYFPFDSGQYLTDYLGALDPDGRLPSAFHVEDTWENYDQLASVLDARFSQKKA